MQSKVSQLAPVSKTHPFNNPAAVRGGLPSEATIRIHDLRLRTYIGFNPEEQANKQDVVINVTIRHDVNPGIFDDVVDDALNYKTITKDVISLVENGRFLLLEKLVADVLCICSSHDAVQTASVTIEKPHALRFADSVSLTMDYLKPEK